MAWFIKFYFASPKRVCHKFDTPSCLSSVYSIFCVFVEDDIVFALLKVFLTICPQMSSPTSTLSKMMLIFSFIVIWYGECEFTSLIRLAFHHDLSTMSLYDVFYEC